MLVPSVLVPSVLTLKKPLACGFFLGLVAYGLHFIWLLDLLIKKSSATVYFSSFLYLIVVVYAASTSAIWFWVTRRPLYFLLTTPIYFLLLDRYMFWFLQSGYPFLNPLIPLMRYKWFVLLLSFLLTGFGWNGGEVRFMPQQKQIVLETRQGESCLLIYLCPTQNKQIHEAAIEIKQQIKLLNLKKQAENYNQICLVGPETTFPFPLNKYKEYVSWWMLGLPKNVTIVLGAYRQEGEKSYQTIFKLERGLIKHTYDKPHRVAFTEKIPRYWKKFDWAKRLFFTKKQPIKKGRKKTGNQSFKLSPNLLLVPLVCSEFFFLSAGELRQKARGVDFCVVFINDSWFAPYFRKIMMLSARLKTLLLGKKILYVGHERCEMTLHSC